VERELTLKKVPMGHTGLELCPKTTGNTPLCEEGGAKSGAVVADEVLESVVANWQHLPEHIKLAIQALIKAGEHQNE
jgi:hypothetical protein